MADTPTTTSPANPDTSAHDVVATNESPARDVVSQAIPTAPAVTAHRLPAERFATLRRHHRLIDAVMMAIIFTFSLVITVSGIDNTAFHQDESRWINRAHYLEGLLDPFGPTWNDQYLTRGQPPVGSYMMGIGLIVQGRDLDTNPAYDFRRDRAWNTEYGTIPDEGDLVAGRRWNAFLGSVSAALVYLAVRQLTNPVGGVVGSLFMIANPLQIWHNRLALADTTLTLTLAILFVVTIQLMRRPNWAWAIAAGVLIGLGGANKFTPIALAFPLAAIGAIMLIRGWWDRRQIPGTKRRGLFGLPAFSDQGWKLISIPFVALGTFVACYPYLWPNPVTRTMRLIEFRQSEGEGQIRIHPDFAVSNPIEGLRMTIEQLGNRWSAIQEPFGTGRVTALGDALSMGDVVLAIAGLALLTWFGLRKGIRSAEFAIAALIVFQTATIIFSMRVAFERYYLPILLGEVVAIGCAVGYAVSPLLRRWTLPSREKAA